MSGLGSGDNGEFTFIDLLAIVSFFIGVGNYNMNMTQDDKQDLMNGLNSKAQELLREMHSHLERQDKKIDAIMEALDVRNKDT